VTRLLVAALAVVAFACEDDPPPVIPDVRPPDPDPEPDAAADAGTDAAPDAEAVPVHGDTCDDPIDIRADYEPDEDGAYHIEGDLGRATTPTPSTGTSRRRTGCSARGSVRATTPT
jgi:hypothetical protein